LPILEIADRMIAVVPGITGLIDRLEEKGLVVRARCKTDRRVIFVAPTEKAPASARRAGRAHRVIARACRRPPVRGPELKKLIRLLEKAWHPTEAESQ
jgi:MarR family transcriptional regulator, 2-MHQ and catechol-resistance regulon repressor